MGHLGRDPEIREGETPRAVLVLATTEYSKVPNTKDEWKENTTWHRVYAWGNLAEKASKIRKGDFVYVEGKLDSYTYDDEKGQKNTMIFVKCKELIPWVKREDQSLNKVSEAKKQDIGVPF
jgi:single-strand DNA-binding protein